jgi:glycerophosphoryl diester phosphodiesterase
VAIDEHWRPGGALHLIGHRGAAALAPENTVAAVLAAADAGATDVELDVHAAPDGSLLAQHDRVRAGTAARRRSDPLPLNAVLEAAAERRLGVYLDVKTLPPGRESSLGAEVDRVGLRFHCVVGSRDLALLATIGAATGLPTSVLFDDPATDVGAAARATGCRFVHPCFDRFRDPRRFLGPELLAAARELDLGIITWNTNDRIEAAAVMEMGVDGVCSDDPRVLVDARGLAGRDPATD